MSTTVKSHSEMQQSVCFVCFSKRAKKCGKGAPVLRNVNYTVAALIKDHVLKDYCELNEESGEFVVNHTWRTKLKADPKHCSHMGPHLETQVPMGTFFSFWVPIESPFSILGIRFLGPIKKF